MRSLFAVSTSNTQDVFTGNGVTTAFPLTFTFLDDSSLVVTRLTISTGSTSTLVLGTDYTVSGGDGSTGTLTTISTYSSSFQIIVDRVEPYLQPMIFTKYGAFPAKVVEKAYDRLVYQIQQLVQRLNRTLRQPIGDTTNISELPVKAERLGKVLAFDATTGDPVLSDSSLSTIESGVSGAVQASTSAAASAAAALASSQSSSVSAAASAASASAAAASAASISLPLSLANGGLGASHSSTSAVVNTLSLSSAIKADATNSITVGYTATAYNNGTISSGSLTPSPANGNLQRYVNNGAHTLVPPSLAGDYTIIIQVTNGASAGTVTTSGFTKATGDTLSTTNGDDFLLFITKLNGFTHLHKQALQ